MNKKNSNINLGSAPIKYMLKLILNNEKFPIDNADLYPGDYLISIAKNIISQNKKLNFDKFDINSNELTKLSVAQSLKIIKFRLIKIT